MFELTISGKVYGFNFGFGFYKEIDKTIKSKADKNGVSQDMGLQYKLAAVMDGNPDAIVDVLDIANKYAKGYERITRADLEEYIETVEDFDALREELLDFFRSSNMTKAKMRLLDAIMNMTPEEKEKIMQNQ